MGPGDIVIWREETVGLLVSDYDFGAGYHGPKAYYVEVLGIRDSLFKKAFWEKDLELLEEKP